MNIAGVSKAIAGAAAAAVTGIGATAVTVPDGSPWYAYVIVGVVNAAISFAVIYLAPANKVR